MGDKFFLYEIKAKQPNGLPHLLADLGDCWIPKYQFPVANSCPAKSRIIPNGRRKSKKAKELA
jgi:hypothetical protein